jgi:alanyl-tRNA synthetase
MKPDEKWRHLCTEAHAASRVLNYALAAVLRKQAAIGAGTARENSSPEEDARLQAAIDAWNDINTQIEEFIAENVGPR